MYRKSLSLAVAIMVAIDGSQLREPCCIFFIPFTLFLFFLQKSNKNSTQIGRIKKN